MKMEEGSYIFFKLKMTFVWNQEKDKPQKLVLLESGGTWNKV